MLGLWGDDVAQRHNGNKSTIPIAAERRIDALEMRKMGYSYRKIGQKLGVSANTAHQDVKKSLEILAKQSNESADQLRHMELERLDIAMNAIGTLVRQGNLGAIDRWLKISERRSKLLGLDAAPRMDYFDMFRQLSDDGIITQAQYDLMRNALARFQASAIGLWKGAGEQN